MIQSEEQVIKNVLNVGNRKLDPVKKELLKNIMNNPHARGPFCGMIFNKAIESSLDIDYLIEQALLVQQTAQEMIKDDNS